MKYFLKFSLKVFFGVKTTNFFKTQNVKRSRPRLSKKGLKTNTDLKKYIAESLQQKTRLHEYQCPLYSYANLSKNAFLDYVHCLLYALLGAATYIKTTLLLIVVHD